MVSLGDIQYGAFPEGTTLLTGSDHLGREINGVALLRARTPALRAVHHDDLVLVATRTLAALDPQLPLARALQSLATEIAAAAVQGEIQDEAVAVAAAAGLPLFRLPPSTSLAGVEASVSQFLADRRLEWYRQRESVQQQLTALAVGGQGLAALAEQMGKLTGAAVAFTSDRGEVPAPYVPPGFSEGDRAVIRGFVDGTIPIPTTGTVSPAGSRSLVRLVSPIKGHPGVTVTLIGPDHTFDGHARIVLDAGASAAAIELARAQAVQETVHRIQGDVISRLIRGEGDTEMLALHAARLGFDPAVPRVAVALSPMPASAETAQSDLLRILRTRLPRVLARHEIHAPIHSDGATLTVMCPVDGAGPPLSRLADRLYRDLRPAMGPHGLAAGVSRPHSGADSFRRAYRDAIAALDLGRSVMPDRPIVHLEDLGAYRLLLAIPDRATLQEFHDTTLGALAAYDRSRGTDLIRTLDAYLAGRNAVEVAKRLTLHRNTLLYRLRRIREIIGLDLDDPETRFNLQLALRVSHALGVDSPCADT